MVTHGVRRNKIAQLTPAHPRHGEAIYR